MTKKDRTPRRTPEQIAADTLASTEKHLVEVKARLVRLVGEKQKAELEVERLTELRDYQAANPLLKKPQEE